MPETKKAGAAKRTLVKSNFARHLKSLTKGLDDRLSEKTIRSRYDALQTAWEDVQFRHDKYLESISEHSDIGNKTFGSTVCVPTTSQFKAESTNT